MVAYCIYTIEDTIAYNLNYFVQIITNTTLVLPILQGCSLLDVDPGSSTNRTVYTFVGSPEAVVSGALNGAKAASGLIDMTKHKGIESLFVISCPF